MCLAPCSQAPSQSRQMPGCECGDCKAHQSASNAHGRHAGRTDLAGRLALRQCVVPYFEPTQTASKEQIHFSSNRRNGGARCAITCAALTS